jgi:dTDP-4-dehydrorhamnose reductase
MGRHTKETTILLTGKNGQVGFELRRTLSPLGKVVAVDVEDVDFTRAGDVRKMVRDIRPQIIVNPAAYTAVDKAESDTDTAHAVNAVAPGVLAEEAKSLDVPLLHYSTDYVFNGAKRSPYLEEDPPNPTTRYGETKRLGEEAVRTSGVRHVILRLAWVFGMRGKNFLLTMLRLGRERREIRVVNDQVGAPTWSRAIAEATVPVVARLLSRSGDQPHGVYHLPSSGKATWFEFASAIFELSRPHLEVAPPDVVPVTTGEFPTPAKRPAYSLLSGNKIRVELGIALPAWRDQLTLALDEAASIDGVFHG